VSDQMKWFKLHFSALTDPGLAVLDGASMWAWCGLGAYTKMHGTAGRLEIKDSPAGLAPVCLCMRVPCEQFEQVVKILPHVTTERRDGMFAVTWANWRKFQEDSTASERMRALRSKRRGEETLPLPPQKPKCNHLEGSRLARYHERCPNYSGPPVESQEHDRECKCEPCCIKWPGPRKVG
jgi:hypothetical protein